MAGERVAPGSSTNWYLSRWLIAVSIGATLCVGCTRTTKLTRKTENFGGSGRVATTQGSAVAVTSDERIVVATNRTDGIVSILRLDSSRPLTELVLDDHRTELAFHPLNASKPWAAVIGADDDTAYVLLRGSADVPGAVVRIVGLHSDNPHEKGRAEVGSEPTSIVIAPSGRRLFVANSADGSISVIPTQTLASEPLYLNARLANSGLLGAGSRDRPGLAHPRALAMTDDGDQDDTDETLYATEFFSQPLADAAVTDPDRNRQGIVYPIDSGGHPPLDGDGNEVPLIPLGAIETGFDDAEGRPTGCFPNQLYGAAARDNRLYITAVCASPAGPVDAGATTAPERAANNFKTLSQPVVFAIDTTTNREVPEQLVLSRQLADAYAEEQPGASAPRMPLLPTEIVFGPDADDSGRQAFVSSFGASAVFPIHYDQTGAGVIGSPSARYVALGDTALPTGMAILSGKRALVLDDKRRGLATVDLANSKVAAWTSTIQEDWSNHPATKPSELVDEQTRSGRRLFATGLGAWSFSGQAWSSCESCHPEGLSDGVTWRFARGPRRSISLAGTYYGAEAQRRMLLWTANIDEIHDVEAIARGVSGGVGGVVWDPYALDHSHTNCRLIYDGSTPSSKDNEVICKKQRATTNRLNGLNGALSDRTRKIPGEGCGPDEGPCDINASADWDQIDAFIKTVQAPRAPILDPGSVAEGRKLFHTQSCDRCHSGPGWTLSRVFYQPGLAANGALPSANPAVADPTYAPDGAAEAALLGTLRTQTFRILGDDIGSFAATIPAIVAGPVPFRTPITSTPGLLANLYAKPPLPDQITCVLRSVGTFGSPMAPDFVGVAPAGAPPVREVRHVLDMDAYADKLATGGTGFNIPSLLGVASGAPYFHAGNARTLEELFDPVFVGHHAALGGPLPTADEVHALVDFLLSIDDATAPLPTPTDGFQPDLCAQFVAP